MLRPTKGTPKAHGCQASEFARGLPLELIGRERLQRLLEQHGLGGDINSTHAAQVEGSRETATPPPEDRAADLLDLAERMCDSKNYGEAAKLYRKVIELRPDTRKSGCNWASVTAS